MTSLSDFVVARAHYIFDIMDNDSTLRVVNRAYVRFADAECTDRECWRLSGDDLPDALATDHISYSWIGILTGDGHIFVRDIADDAPITLRNWELARDKHRISAPLPVAQDEVHRRLAEFLLQRYPAVFPQLGNLLPARPEIAVETFFPADYPHASQPIIIPLAGLYLFGGLGYTPPPLSERTLAVTNVLPATIEWFGRLGMGDSALPGDPGVIAQIFEICAELGLEFR